MKQLFVLECLIDYIKEILRNNMYKSLNIFAFLIFFSFLIQAHPVKAEEIMGFDAKSDVKIGPILKIGFPISTYNSNISYLPNVSLDIHGESFIHGTTGFIFNWISSSRNFVPLVAGKTTFSEVSPGNSATKITKNLLMLTLISPIGFSPDSKFELGWMGGIFSQFVNLDNNIPGDTSSNIGINLGTYAKAYHLYPFVPSISGKIILGNLYDNGKTFQDKTLSSSIKLGYFLNAGFDFYLTKRIVLNVGYNMMNPDFLTFSPTKTNTVPKAGQTTVTAQPADDTAFNFAELVQTVNASVGFLF
jgi:hypothetical protein